MGFDTEMFTLLLIASRITGWSAHVMEQRANNALIRPLSAYNGPDERQLPGKGNRLSRRGARTRDVRQMPTPIGLRRRKTPSV